MMTDQARRFIEAYFGKLLDRGQRLPERLWQWVQAQDVPLRHGETLPPPHRLLRVEQQDKRLIVRLLTSQGGDSLQLMLEEEPCACSSALLEGLGLTTREAEILYWVMQGKTNPEIGIILGLSFRTVRTHLEHVYDKLGVGTRTAAALQALEALSVLKR